MDYKEGKSEDSLYYLWNTYIYDVSMMQVKE